MLLILGQQLSKVDLMLVRVLNLLTVGEPRRFPLYRVQHTPHFVFLVWAHRSSVPVQSPYGIAVPSL